MKKRLHFVLLSSASLLVLVFSAVRPLTAYADDGTPQPPDATQTVDSGGGTSTDPAPTDQPTDVAPTPQPADAATATDAAPTDPAATATALPDGTSLVVLDATGTAVPLASQQAADIITNGDPIWCPAGASPVAGAGGCTASYADLGSLVAALTGGSQPTSNGTIWITDGTDATGSTVSIDGSSLTTWADYSLTLQGGWDGSGAGTIVGATTFNNPLAVANWNNDVTLNDLIFENTGGGASVDVQTTGNVALNNVEASDNSSGDGAYVSADGNVTIHNSRFRNNSSNGLEVYSNDQATLTNVYANWNGDDGAYVETDSNLTVTGGTFNNNAGDGLYAYSDSGDISISNADAQDNAYNGLTLYANDGAASVNGGGFDYNSGYGIDIGDSGYAYSDITLSNLFAADNYNGGAYLYSEGGGVTVTNSVFNDNYQNGYGLYADANGDIALTGVTSIWNNDGGVQLRTPGNVTVSNSVFNRNDGAGMDVGYSLGSIGGNVTLTNVEASGNNGDGFQASVGVFAYIDGNFTLNGGTFNNNNGYGINLYESTGTVSLSNVQANGNNSDGAYLDNSSGIGNVTITSSSFDYNGDHGLSVYTAGAVNLNGVTANGNSDSGAGITNNFSGGSVSVSNSQFNNNLDKGLYVFSSTGNLTLMNVLANFNDGTGADITTDGAVSINSSKFNVNGVNGLSVTTSGNISLNNVSAGADGFNGAYLFTGGSITDSGTNSFNYNGSVGTDCFGGINVSSGTATLDNCQDVDTNVWFTSGGTLYSYGDINSALTAIAGGLPPDGGALHVDSALTPYLENASIDGTDPYLGQITQFLGGGSSSTLVAGNLQFHDLGGGFSLSGLTFSDYVEGWDNIGAINVTNVSAAGLETSSNNCDNGASIDICSNDGSISLDNVNASGGNGSGAYLDNSESSSYSPINITNSTFSGNYYAGLEEVDAYGAITLSNVAASFNRGTPYNGGTGAYLYNKYGSPGTAKDVSVSNSTFSYNANDYGLVAYSYGNITLTNVTADGNYYDGAYLEADGNTSNLSVTGGSFNYNYDADSSGGLEAYNYGNGNITLTNTTVTGNGDYNAYLYQDGSTGNVSVSNSTFNYAYDESSLTVYNYSVGNITLTNVTANNSYGANAYLYGDGPTGNVSVTNSAFNYSQENYGLEVYNYAAGSLNVSGVTANGNYYSGAYLDNDFGGGPGGVSVTNSTFNNTVYDNGLNVYNYNDSDTSLINLTANGNDGDGAYVSAGFNVVVDPSTFNYNGTYGLEVYSGGDITVDHITAISNGDDGAYLSASGDTSVNCGSYKNNLGYGVDSSASSLTLNSVTFGGNSYGDYYSNVAPTINTGGNCNQKKNGAPPVGPFLPWNIVPVSGGEGIGLDCTLYRGTVLMLSNHDQIVLPCPIDGQASLQHDAQDKLPGKLDDKFSFLSAMESQVSPSLNGTMLVDFVIPAGKQASSLTILHWDGSKWVDLGGAVNADGFFEVASNLDGVFVLVSK